MWDQTNGRPLPAPDPLALREARRGDARRRRRTGFRPVGLVRPPLHDAGDVEIADCRPTTRRRCAARASIADAGRAAHGDRRGARRARRSGATRRACSTRSSTSSESPVVLAGQLRRAFLGAARAGDRDGDAVPPALLPARRQPVRVRRERRRPRRRFGPATCASSRGVSRTPRSRSSGTSERGIDGLADRLGAITFFAGAGSFADKSERLRRLVERARRRRRVASRRRGWPRPTRPPSSSASSRSSRA